MALPAAGRRLLSAEEYLAREDASPVKHEYVAGVIYALAGSTERHNQIVGNLFRALSAHAGGRCRVYFVDVKLRAAADVYYYPDLMVACGPDRGDPLVEDAPCLIVEVTSPSTVAIDQREKLAAYKRIPSLEAYLIVDQDRRLVRRFWREADAWWNAELAGNGMVPLPCPPGELDLADVYAGVELPGE